MTTCAWDGNELAADSWQTRDNGAVDFCVKIHRLPDGSMLADSGSSVDCEKMRAWLAGEAAKPTFEDAEFAVLHVVGPDCGFLYEDTTTPVEVSPPCSIGSGAKAAQALMLAAGYSAQQAVQAIIDHDIDCFTGGRMKVIDTSNIVRTALPARPKITLNKRKRKSRN